MIDYIKILKPTQETTQNEMKTTYRTLVKKNHPDLFPVAERGKQNLILMEINEAYFKVISGDMLTLQEKKQSKQQKNRTVSSTKLVPVKNEDYIYYKKGIELFQQGYSNLTKNRSLKNIEANTKTDPGNLITAAISSLKYFHESYNYFYKITIHFPTSVWLQDATDKMNEIEKLNIRYSVIIEALSDKNK